LQPVVRDQRQRAGNPDLKPETSNTWSAGVVLEPHFLDTTVGRITLTADYWNVKQKGIVGIFGEGNALIADYLARVGGGTNANVVRAARPQTISHSSPDRDSSQRAGYSTSKIATSICCRSRRPASTSPSTGGCRTLVRGG
jgi:outer membrane receptor protein involved in Fe transport